MDENAEIEQTVADFERFHAKLWERKVLPIMIKYFVNDQIGIVFDTTFLFDPLSVNEDDLALMSDFKERCNVDIAFAETFHGFAVDEGIFYENDKSPDMPLPIAMELSRKIARPKEGNILDFPIK
jgi:hypothetical protein